MAGRSSSDLRDALLASFGASPRGLVKLPKKGRKRGQRSSSGQQANALKALKSSFTTPGPAPFPRPALGAALWNLAVQHLAARSAGKHPPPGHKQLDPLVKSVFGWSLDELYVMQLDNIDPLFALAAQFGLFIDRWVPPRLDGNVVHATLEVSVQSPLGDLREALEPPHWAKRCELFWNKVAPASKSIFHPRSPARSFKGQLHLDGAPAPVRVECDASGDNLGFRNTFTIRQAGGRVPGSVHSSGSIRAEKHRAKAWWTQIRHRKTMAVEDRAPRDAENLLSYWIQVETACLTLGN